MEYSISQQFPGTKESAPLLDAILVDDDILTVEIQRRIGNKAVIYLHVNGVTTARFIGKESRIEFEIEPELLEDR